MNDPGRRNTSEEDDIRHLGFPHDKISDKTVPATPILIAAAYGSDEALSSMLTHSRMYEVFSDPTLTGEALCFAVHYRRPVCVGLLAVLWPKPDPHAGMRSLMSKHMELSRHQGSSRRRLEGERQAGRDEAARAEKAISSQLEDAMKSEANGLKFKVEMLQKELMMVRGGPRKVQLMNRLEELLEKLNEKKESLLRSAEQQSPPQQQQQQEAAAAAAEAAAAEEEASTAADKMAQELLDEEEEEALRDTFMQKVKKHAKRAKKASKKLNKEVVEDSGDNDVNKKPQPDGIEESGSSSSSHQHHQGGCTPPRHQTDIIGSSSSTIAADANSEQQQSQSATVAVHDASAAPISPIISSSRHAANTTPTNDDGGSTSSHHQATPLSLAERLGLRVPIPVFVSTPSPS